MMNSYSSNAITAKARAIYGKRLTSADYHELLRQRTVSDVASYLKTSTSYSKYLSGISEMQIHRGQLELLLNRSRLEKFVSLCHYDFSKSRSFYHYAIMDMEISMILRAIVHLNSDSPQNIITGLPLYMQDYISYDFMALSNIRNFDDLLKVLEGTPYAAVLKVFREENGQIRLTDCELALKTYYYKRTLSIIDRNYKGALRKELRETILMEIDLTNLALIYRLNILFRRSPEQIRAQLLPFSFRLTPRAVENLLAVQTDAEFVSALRLSAYHPKEKDAEFHYIEDYTKRLKHLITRKEIRFSSSAPIAFYALITLLRIETENITLIIEGIRYGHPLSEIEKLLILD